MLKPFALSVAANGREVEAFGSSIL